MALLNWIDTVFFGVRRILAGGVELDERNSLNFAAPLVVVDNATDKRTDVSVPAAAAGTAGTAPATTGADKVLCAPGNAPGWAKIVDANVDSAAAVAGTKIAPNFGSQAVSTTGAGTFATLNAGTAPFAATGQIRLPASPSIHAVRVAGGTVELFTVTVDAVVTGEGSSLYTVTSDGQIRVDSANSVRLRFSGSDRLVVTGTEVEAAVLIVAAGGIEGAAGGPLLATAGLTVSGGNVLVDGGSLTVDSGGVTADGFSGPGGTPMVADDGLLVLAGPTTFTGHVSASVGSAMNDYAVASTANALYINPTSAIDVTGIAAGQTAGRVLWLINRGVNAMTIKNNSGSSTAANRFRTPNQVDYTLASMSAVRLLYSAVDSVWFIT